MKKVDELLKNGATNMASSLGVGATSGGQAIAPAKPAGPDKYAGRTRGNVGELAIAMIIPDQDQPRKEFDEEDLARLAESLKTHGQLQPVRVRWSASHAKWVLVAGERRYRAAVRAGLAKLAAVFVEEENVPAAIVLEEQLIENCMRSDLKPIEQAQAFRRLMDMTGWTGKDVADRLKLHRTWVTRILQLLELPAPVQEKIEAGDIAPTIGVELAKIDDHEKQMEVAEKIVTEQLTRAEVVEAVQEAKKRKERSSGKSKDKGPTRMKEFAFKTKDRSATVTVALKKAGTAVEARLALLEVLESLPAVAGEEGRAAA